MKLYVALAVIFCVAPAVLGRFLDDAQIDPLGRTLKGVLKYYKDQPRVTDSESIEFEEVDSQVPVNNEILEKLHQKNAVVPKETPTESSNIQNDNAEAGETTVSPVVLEPEESQSMSKSGLDEDELDDIDDLVDCAEGDVLKVSCNTCVCSDGKYFCSKKQCDGKPKPLPPREKGSSKRKGGLIKYHTVKGESRPESDVSDISVNANTNATAELEQPEGNSTTVAVVEVDSRQCIDGRTKPVDCNQCVCAMGQWACTKVACIALSLREKASYNGQQFLKSVASLKEHTNIDEDCLEGETKPVGCNQCVCHSNSWACSDFSCPATTPPPKAENIRESCQTEEDVKSKDCNICSCRRGVWVCTQNDCKKFGNRYFNPVNEKTQSNEE